MNQKIQNEKRTSGKIVIEFSTDESNMCNYYDTVDIAELLQELLERKYKFEATRLDSMIVQIGEKNRFELIYCTRCNKLATNYSCNKAHQSDIEKA